MHFFISVEGLTNENFETVYFKVLNEITNELHLGKPVFDVSIGSKEKLSIITGDKIKINRNYIPFPYKLEDGDINKVKLIKNHLNIDNLFIERKVKIISQILLDNWKHKIDFKEKKQEYQDVLIKNEDSDKFLEKKYKGFNFYYSDDGNEMVKSFFARTGNFNIPPDELRSFFFKNVTFSDKIEKKYDDFEKWSENKFTRTQIPGIYKSVKKIIETSDSTIEDTINDIVESKEGKTDGIIYLSGSEKIDSKFITARKLFIEADTKSGKTYTTVKARYETLQKGEYIILVVPNVELVLDKYDEFTKIYPNVQAIHGSSAEKKLTGVKISDINYDNKVFITTLEGFLEKLNQLETKSVHLILDEIHSYLMYYNIKPDIIERVFNKIQYFEYASITALTGTKIESKFFDIFDDYILIRFRFNDLTNAKLHIIDKNMNCLIKKVIRRYETLKDDECIILFNNSIKTENKVIRDIIIKEVHDSEIVILVDSKNGLWGKGNYKIIICSTTMELGLGLNKKINSIFVNPSLANPANLLSVESLIQILGRGDRSRLDVSYQTEIFVYMKDYNYDAEYVSFYEKNWKRIALEIENALHSKIIITNQKNTRSIIDVKNIKNQLQFHNENNLNIYQKAVIEYNLQKLYYYLNSNEFYKIFSNRFIRISNTIDKNIPENNAILLYSNFYKNKFEKILRDKKKLEQYICSKIKHEPTQDNEEFEEHFREFAQSTNYPEYAEEIREYIDEYGFQKTYNDFSQLKFYSMNDKTNYAILYNLMNIEFEDSIEKITKLLHLNKLFLPYNSKTIRKELLKYVGIKKTQNGKYKITFPENNKIFSIKIAESLQEANKIHFTEYMSGEEIFNKLHQNNPAIKRVFMGYKNVEEFLKSFKRYCATKNILLCKEKIDGVLKYKIIKHKWDELLKGEFTKTEVEQITGEKLFKVQKVLKQQGSCLIKKQKKILGKNTVLYKKATLI